jgi:hypothetical protein
MKQAGESHEMAARWIMEDLTKAGFSVVSVPLNQQENRS